MYGSRSDAWPATGATNINVTSSDRTFDPPLRGISIGTAGTLKIDTIDDLGITIPSNCLAIGIQHAICIKKIYSSGTSATELVGWR